MRIEFRSAEWRRNAILKEQLERECREKEMGKIRIVIPKKLLFRESFGSLIMSTEAAAVNLEGGG